MCVTPRTIWKSVSGEFRPFQVACRYCWQCRSNRVWDWVGRAIAENETASRSFFVTMTYGHTTKLDEVLDERATSLHYPDVQKWLKRIRRQHAVRYIVTGEYGSRKGRAHWHALLFFRDTFPDVKLRFKYWGNRDFNTDPFWKEGLTEWDAFSPEGAKYVTKYMLKAEEEGGLTHAMLSKKPPLGAAYFKARAARYVEQGLSPQDLVYSFPEVTYGRKNRTPREFHLQGVSADYFLGHYVEMWRARHGRDSWPFSELVDDYLNRQVEYEAVPEPVRYRPYSPPDQPAPDGYIVAVDEKLNSWVAIHPERRAAPLFWSFDDEGNRAWRDVLVTETQAMRFREESGSLLTQDAYREASQALDPRRGSSRRIR